MSIVIVSNRADSAPEFQELRSTQPVTAVAAPAANAADGSADGTADYWRIPATPDNDEDFLYQPARPSSAPPPAPKVRDETAAPPAETSDWAEFDSITADDIARETPQNVARLFSYSLW